MLFSGSNSRKGVQLKVLPGLLMGRMAPHVKACENHSSHSYIASEEGTTALATVCCWGLHQHRPAAELPICRRAHACVRVRCMRSCPGPSHMRHCDQSSGPRPFHTAHLATACCLADGCCCCTCWVELLVAGTRECCACCCDGLGVAAGCRLSTATSTLTSTHAGRSTLALQ
jgi:hypothetical protein